jgi:hypothetical protein
MEEKEGWVVEDGAEDKGDDGGGGAPGGAALVSAVQSFFYENDDFAEIFERFANENCDVIDLASEEMKLEYTELHQEFVSIFEEQMEGFIESQGSSVIDFYTVLREAADRDPDSNESLLGQIMYATCDFDVFMLMMRETKRRQDWTRAEEAEQEQRQQQNNRK